MSYFPIGAGAGFVSALLIAVVARGTPLALLLFLLAPIPILVVSLGWNHRAGLVGAATGALVSALVGGLDAGIGFILGTALPAWWLSYLALLGRPTATGAIEWYPLGDLLAWIAATASITFLAASVMSAGSYEAYAQDTRTLAELFLRAQTGIAEPAPLPDFGGVPAAQVVQRFADAAPILAAQGFTLVLTLYVWLSARIVAMSGHLVRPWPDVPGTLMRRRMVAILGGALVASFVVDGFAGVFARSLAGALVLAFGLQGLAGLHEITRGRPGRGAMLAAAYLLVVLSQGLFLLPLILFGITDSALRIRPRLRSRRKPPLTPFT